MRPTTVTILQQPTRRRWVLAILTALMVVAALVLAAGTASAATGPAAENRIRASAFAAATLDRLPQDVSADQRLGKTLPQPGIVVATGVAANTADDIPLGAMCSFAGATPVLMADGSHKPIEDIEVGDKVVATDPETGEHAAMPVTHVWVHADDLFEFEVNGELIVTTEDHPFWSATDQAWEGPETLDRGEQVLTADATLVAVTREIDLDTRRSGPAYNLTVAGLHTYHVGENDVLVHNRNGCNLNSITRQQSDDIASFLGYTKTRARSATGAPIWKNSKAGAGQPTYITWDRNGHNGGIFKGSNDRNPFQSTGSGARDGTFDLDIASMRRRLPRPDKDRQVIEIAIAPRDEVVRTELGDAEGWAAFEEQLGSALKQLARTVVATQFEVMDLFVGEPTTGDAAELRNGSVLTVTETVNLVARMAAGHGPYCTLLAAGIRIEPSWDGVTHVFLESSLSTSRLGNSLTALRIDRRDGVTPDQPDGPAVATVADDDFWSSVAAAPAGLKLLCERWAHGSHGARWYRLDCEGGLVVPPVEPRSLVSVLLDPVIDIQRLDVHEGLVALALPDVAGRVPHEEYPLGVDSRRELVERGWKSAVAENETWTWVAVVPDPDGTVRAAWAIPD